MIPYRKTTKRKLAVLKLKGGASWRKENNCESKFFGQISPVCDAY